MADDSTLAAAPAATKPLKPDTDLFNEKLGKTQKEHDDAMKKLKAIRDQIAHAQGNKDIPSPTQQRRKELIAQANEIRQKQGAGKNMRGAKLDQIKRLDEQLRSRIAEQKAARGKVNFKSVEDLDCEIARLDANVSSGKMKIVDEKKALAEISNLRKSRKNFAQFEDAQKKIDDLRATIKEIKDSMDDPEAKALSARYDKIQAELDAIKAEQDKAYQSLSSLRDERSKLHAEQITTFAAVKKIKDDYYQAKSAYGLWERDQRQKARERQQSERDRIVKEKKMERAQRMLAEASDPAYLEEIRRANSLLHFFDPSHQAENVQKPLLADKGLGAQAQRKVDDSGIRGMKLVSKKNFDDEYMPGAKKGKRGRKTASSETSGNKFNCPPSVIDDCSFLNIDPPMSPADVLDVIEKVKAKLEHWKADQAEQTKKNIEKATKDIEKLEAQEADEASNHINSRVESAAMFEVTEAVKNASLEDQAVAAA